MASSSSLSPPETPMELHVANRKKLVDSFRDHLSCSSRPLSGFVFLQGGEEQTRHCTDHIELFRQESYFAYLFGVQEPGFYGAIDIATGESLLFAPRLPADYAVWLGEIKSLSYFKEKYMVSSAYYTDEITKVLHPQYQGSGEPLLYLLHGLNTDSNNFSKPADFEGIDNFKTDLNALHPILTECRVLKSALELSLIQFANDISSEAHVEIHTKKGNRLHQKRMNDLVFVMYNMILWQKQEKRASRMERPIILKEVPSDDEWITEREEHVLPTDGAWLAAFDRASRRYARESARNEDESTDE